MKANTVFQPTRIFLLIRNSIVLNRSSILVITSALIGISACFSMLDTFGSLNPQFHRNMYLFILFSGGIWLTSRIFKTFHDPLEGFSCLLLPASSLEKTISIILLSSIVYIACSLIAYSLFSIVSEGLNRLVLGRYHLLCNPFNPLILKGISIYFVVQAPFLIGAVYFKKHVLSKTILSLLLLLLFLGLGIAISVWVIFGQALYSHGVQSLFDRIIYSGIAGISPSLLFFLKTLILIVVPLVSWIICYYRHTETEL